MRRQARRDLWRSRRPPEQRKTVRSLQVRAAGRPRRTLAASELAGPAAAPKAEAPASDSVDTDTSAFRSRIEVACSTITPPARRRARSRTRRRRGRNHPAVGWLRRPTAPDASGESDNLIAEQSEVFSEIYRMGLGRAAPTSATPGLGAHGYNIERAVRWAGSRRGRSRRMRMWCTTPKAQAQPPALQHRTKRAACERARPKCMRPEFSTSACLILAACRSSLATESCMPSRIPIVAPILLSTSWRPFAHVLSHKAKIRDAGTNKTSRANTAIQG